MSLIDNLRQQAKGLETVCDQLQAENKYLRSLLERAYGAVAVDKNFSLLKKIDEVLSKERVDV